MSDRRSPSGAAAKSQSDAAHPPSGARELRDVRLALERSERELAAAQQLAGLGSWEWDLDSNELHRSDALYDLFGLDRGTVASLDAYMALVNPEDRVLVTPIRDALSRHGDFRHEVRMRRPDGEIVVECRGRVVRDAAGRPTAMRGTAQDVTEARRHDRIRSAVIEFAFDCIVAMDHTGRITEFNAAASRVFGYTREQALGREVAELLIPARLRAAYDQAFAHEVQSEKSQISGRRVEMPMRRSDGSEVPVELTVTTTDDAPRTFVGFIRDLSSQHEAVDAARISGERFRHIVETSREGIWTIDNEGRTTLVNPAMALMLGYEPPDMMGRELFEFMDAEAAAQVRAEMASYGNFTPPEIEGRFKHRDGSDVWVVKRASPLLDESGKRVGGLAMFTDITERRAATQREQLLAAIVEASDDAIIAKTPKGVVTAWNAGAERLYGYTAQEAIGADLAELIIPPERAGESDEIVDAATFHGVVDHRETERQRKDGHRVQVTLTSYPTFDHAGKVTGVGVVARDITERKAHEENLQRELESVVWVRRIREALDEDRFVLWGQPIIDLRSDETVQEELLIRMLDREGQIVAPGEFLPAAEKYGLIGDIDNWVVKHAFALAAAGTNVEVNLSAESVGRPAMLATVERGLEASGADPAKIIFEITETALMQNMEAGTEFSQRLSELGCQFALDDFGTGFGSFTYLKQLPVDYLKIDVEFVRELASDPANKHVVQAVVNLAKGFGIKTVAEGVEDKDTLQLLRDFGVDYAQGYYIGRPAPLSEAPTTTKTPEGMER